MSLRLAQGESCSFSIAGLGIRVESRLPQPVEFELPAPYRAFASKAPTDALRIVLRASPETPQPCGEVVFDSGLNWRVRRGKGHLVCFETYHPPSARIVATAEPQSSLEHFSVSFEEETCRWLSRRPAGHPLKLELPYPLGQLLFLPALAARGGFLVHASAAVVGGRAYAFAGHSGDGKTTLARLLVEEGVEILSDERVALRLRDDRFFAYGTPWPGEGDIASAREVPLGGVFLLRKAARHGIREAPGARKVGDLLARSIIPYYLAQESERILSLVDTLASKVPIRELAFARAPGVAALLAEDARYRPDLL